MHSPTSLFIFTAVIFLASAQSIRFLYVKSNNFSASDCQNQPCQSLNQYAEEKANYFISGSTFVFLPGNHSLQTQLNLSNVSRITLKSMKMDSNVNIICTTKVTIRCENVTSFNIERLTFLLQLNHHEVASALVFINSKDIMIKSSLFLGSSNYVFGKFLFYCCQLLF